MLCLDGKGERALFAGIVALPEPLEEVEAELAAERFLDDLAVALAGVRGERVAYLIATGMVAMSIRQLQTETTSFCTGSLVLVSTSENA